jgi:hypothetical protein
MSVPGPNVLLVGATGVGKTHAIRTLLDTGIEQVFVIFTEPGMEVLSDLPAEQVHWHYIPPANADWEQMIASATKINTMNFEALSKLSDMNKKHYSQFIQVLETLHDFTCDRTGENFGDITNFGTKRAVVIDSLSGLNIMAMDLVVGSKPTKSLSDWGVAMDNLERLVQKMCTDTTCTFVLTAHLEREVDEVLGGVKLMASTLGRKLAPRLPRFFSDVVHCQRKGAEFSWSTASLNVDLKARNLPINDNLPPTFEPMMKRWVEQGGEYSSYTLDGV